MQRILIIDDDPDLCRFLKRSLENDGYEIVTVSRCNEISPALEETWDLILLDVSMPQIDGWAVAERVRRSGLPSPLYFMSGRADSTFEEARKEGLIQGALQKPFGYDEIRDFLAMVCTAPR